MFDFVAAIDGGGTKTASAIADKAGNVSFLPARAGCNPQDSNSWREILEEILGSLPNHCFVVMGMPGYAEIPRDDEDTKNLFQDHLGSDFYLINDVELAYVGSFPEGNGILLLAGTGSMTVGGNEQSIIRGGGWGEQFGDEGSAYWIGRRALALASREIDGRSKPTGFSAKLSKAIGATSHEFALLEWSQAFRPARAHIAGLAKVVDELANDGDQAASALLEDAAKELILLAKATANRLELGQNFEWSQAGSTFKSHIVQAAVERELGSPVAGQMSALGGGLRLAARRTGWSVDPEWIAKVASATGAEKFEPVI